MTQDEIEEVRRDLPPGYRLCAPKRKGPQRRPNSPAIYCYRIKRESVFYLRKSRTKVVRTNQCKDCWQATQDGYTKLNAERNAARARAWNDAHRERAQQHRRNSYRRLTADPERREARNRQIAEYRRRNRPRVNQWERNGRARKMRARKARLPREPVMPYLEWMVRIAHQQVEDERSAGVVYSDTPRHPRGAQGDTLKGYTRLAEWMGIDESTVRKLFTGRAATVSQYAIDGLACRPEAEFTLYEVLDRAREWAVLTGDSWPFGYKLEHEDPRRPSADKTAS
jgi:hypothetical protein